MRMTRIVLFLVLVVFDCDDGNEAHQFQAVFVVVVWKTPVLVLLFGYGWTMMVLVVLVD